MIRLDPRHPPPAVDMEEWDGLVKMIFNRKNKKLASIVRLKSTVEALYAKYKAYHAKAENAGEAVVADVDEAGFKSLLEMLLVDPIFERRARTLSIEEVAVILQLFHNRGIHFL